MPEVNINYFTTHHLLCKEKSGIIESIYRFSLFPLFSKLSLLFHISFDYILISTSYYLYYKEKLWTIEIIKKSIINLATFAFVFNSNSYANQLNLMIEKS